jgi:5-methylcytosine-specific restriction enzyme B
MSETMKLDIERTYAAIVSAARARRFITYAEIADASGVPWQVARRPLPVQLDRLVRIAHERGWPLITAIVVPQDQKESGQLEGSALEGFLAAAGRIGMEVDQPEAFVQEHQEATFDWAADAPDTLGADSADSWVTGQGPKFVRYFGPVLDALRAKNGSAVPEEVFAWIEAHTEVPQEDLATVQKSGQTRFQNSVGWARFYLTKAGLIDGATRGLWKLSPEGRDTHLDGETAYQLFKSIRAQFQVAEEEDEPAPDTVSPGELLADPSRQFWFVGAVWNDDEDQLDRFVEEGVWQNGYDTKFTEHVLRMRAGDRIAIKSSFVQKYNLPFDNKGKPVSVMRIKAIGTITGTAGDGKTVQVQWERLDPPRDWFFYTYRVTVVQADPSEEYARRLILFTFGNGKQDYDFWMTKVPYFARRYGAVSTPSEDVESLATDLIETEEEAAAPSYTIDNIEAEGSFLSRGELERALKRIRAKKNLILQGPPGTGKTWLAKRLAYTLLGSRDRKVTRARLRIVQFHPSLSYEDFVRGWRPGSQGTLALMDGIFLETVQAAAAEPDRPFVLIIEEINRGNPAQIFGELLTLLEDTKRNPDDAIELAYRHSDSERVFVPPNLHVLGTMNVADRSLALVDLALRRRFAFITLEPLFNDLWASWLRDQFGVTSSAIATITQRMRALNENIAADRSLGPQYRVGHSYVTPPPNAVITSPERWFEEVVETEIMPLLEEYWYDAQDKVGGTREQLLAPWPQP